MAQPFEPSGIVTLTTDFGRGDYYTAAVRGVILSIERTLEVISATHHIPPQNVLSAAYVLDNFAFEFPAGTVHVVAVDPGVGSQRNCLCCLMKGQAFVGPDNGFLSFVLQRGVSEAWLVAPGRLSRERCAPTFHCRDLFAPVAAFLAAGRLRPWDLGPRHSPFVLPGLRATATGNVLRGLVVHVDSFGNLITNIPCDGLDFRRLREVKVAGRVVDLVGEFYVEHPAGSLIAMPGDTGRLEIAEVMGSAARALSACQGMEVIVILEAEPRP